MNLPVAQVAVGSAASEMVDLAVAALRPDSPDCWGPRIRERY